MEIYMSSSLIRGSKLNLITMDLINQTLDYTVYFGELEEDSPIYPTVEII